MFDADEYDLSAFEAMVVMQEGYVVEDNEHLYHYTIAEQGEVYKYRKSEGHFLTDLEFMRLGCFFKALEAESRTFVS